MKRLGGLSYLGALAYCIFAVLLINESAIAIRTLREFYVWFGERLSTHDLSSNIKSSLTTDFSANLVVFDVSTGLRSKSFYKVTSTLNPSSEASQARVATTNDDLLSIAATLLDGLLWVCSYVCQVRYHFLSYVTVTPPSTPDLCAYRKGPDPRRDNQCSYCWEVMGPNDDVLTHSRCANSWHPLCLTMWMQSRREPFIICPLCAEAISSPAILVKPDGEKGHAWRPAVLELVIQKLLLCIVLGMAEWVFCHGCNKVLSAWSQITDNSLATRPDLSITIAATISCTMQLQMHWLIVQYFQRWPRFSRNALVLWTNYAATRALSTELAHFMPSTWTTPYCVSGYGQLIAIILLKGSEAMVFNENKEGWGWPF